MCGHWLSVAKNASIYIEQGDTAPFAADLNSLGAARTNLAQSSRLGPTAAFCHMLYSLSLCGPALNPLMVQRFVSLRIAAVSPGYVTLTLQIEPALGSFRPAYRFERDDVTQLPQGLQRDVIVLLP